MAIIEGAYTTSGVIGGSYFDWWFEWLPVEIGVTQPDVMAAMQDPQSYVMDEFTVRATVTDQNTSTTYDLTPSLVQASIDSNSQNAQDSFSLTLADAVTWSPFGAAHPALLQAGDLSKIVKLFLDFKLTGTVRTFQIFTGTMTAVSPKFRRGNSSMSVTGSNLAEFLRTQDGSLAFSGTLYNLVMKLLLRAGIRDAYLAIPDNVLSITLFSTTVEASLAQLFVSMGDLDHFVDNYGFYVARPVNHAGSQGWTYDTQKNVSEINPGQASGALVTEVNVIGSTTIGSLEYGDAGKQAVYGFRQTALSSVSVQTLAQANISAQATIDRSFRALLQTTVMATNINPSLEPGDIVTIKDDAAIGIGTNLDARTMVVRWLRLVWQRSSPGGSFSFGGELTS